MPKVSEEHKERRREQILDGARRCFAQHGYEGATVARLEQEIGLSRGAIFNYFPSKDALFVELALEMSRRLHGHLAQRGLPRRARCDRRRIRTGSPSSSRPLAASAPTPEFRRLLEEREQELTATRAERLDRLRPQVRDDVPIESVAILLSFVANGLALGCRSATRARPRRDREARGRGRRARASASRSQTRTDVPTYRFRSAAVRLRPSAARWASAVRTNSGSLPHSTQS